MAKRGDLRGAVEAYRQIAEDPRPEVQPFRDMSRYEMARLWGFGLGEIQRARSILRSLAAHGGGEVSRQASLALCELDLAARPCQAAACLRELTEHGTDFQLAQEAKGLLSHWDLEDADCPPGEP